MIAPEVIQKIKESVPLLPEVRPHVRLQKSGPHSWKGQCPFHQERTPSFVVHSRGDPKHPNTFKCFGCQASGDVIDFVSLIGSITKGRAIRELAERYKIELTIIGRKQGGYVSDFDDRCEFWWEVRRARVHARFEAAIEAYWAAAEANVGVQAAGRKAEHYGQVLRWIDGLPYSERKRMFIAFQNEADLKAYRESMESVEWLQHNIAETPGLERVVDRWAEGGHV